MNKCIFAVVFVFILSSMSYAQIDISHLTHEQQARVKKAFTSQNCTCGCEMTIAECLTDDPSCDVSPELAKVIIDEISNESAPIALKRIDISHLTTKQQNQIIEVLNTQNCTCGCGMTITKCLIDDPSCDVSPNLAQVVVNAIVSGKTVASSNNSKPNQLKSDNGKWYQEVVGRQLVYIYVGMGYREKYQIWLCSGGSFQSSGQGGSVSSLGSGAFSDGGNSGNWAVNGNILTLAYASGETKNFTLSIHEGFLYLNNTKYYRTDNEVCN